MVEQQIVFPLEKLEPPPVQGRIKTEEDNEKKRQEPLDIYLDTELLGDVPRLPLEEGLLTVANGEEIPLPEYNE